jgi:drug/metabolite transporter (DMT)-like permease
MANTRQIASMMAFVAATLAVASILHLSGALSDGSKPFRPSGAGVAEAVICVVLVAGAGALFRHPVRGRRPALAALAFAILGFIVGLRFTISGGAAIDLAYHVAMLPLLVLTIAALLRHRREHAPV